MVEKKPQPRQETSRKPVEISLFGPLLFWIGLLVLAAVVQLFLFPLAEGTYVSTTMADLNILSDYLLYIPGIFILPMIAALMIGDRIGESPADDYVQLTYRALLNSLYASVVYIIGIFMIYIASTSLRVGVLSHLSLTTFGEYLVFIPVGITIVVVILFAVLTRARRY